MLFLVLLLLGEGLALLWIVEDGRLGGLGGSEKERSEPCVGQRGRVLRRQAGRTERGRQLWLLALANRGGWDGGGGQNQGRSDSKRGGLPEHCVTGEETTSLYGDCRSFIIAGRKTASEITPGNRTWLIGKRSFDLRVYEGPSYSLDTETEGPDVYGSERCEALEEIEAGSNGMESVATERSIGSRGEYS